MSKSQESCFWSCTPLLFFLFLPLHEQYIGDELLVSAALLLFFFPFRLNSVQPGKKCYCFVCHESSDFLQQYEKARANYINSEGKWIYKKK